MATVKELQLRQTEIRPRLAELDSQHGGEELPAAERDEWNKLNEEFDANDALIEELEARRSRIQHVSQDEESTEPPEQAQSRRPRARTAPDDPFNLVEYRKRANSIDDLPDLYRDGALRVLEQSYFPHPRAKREDVQAHIERLLTKHRLGGEVAHRVIATGSETYRRAFVKRWGGLPLTRDEERALSTTTTAGGFAVPYTLDPTIIPTSNGSVNPFRQIARVETITGNTWNGVSSAGVSAGYRAEAAEAADGAPTVAQPTVAVQMADVFIPFSVEIGMDWGQLADEMARLVQDAKDDLEADKFVTGIVASNQPQGLLVGATAVIATAAATTIAAGDIYGLDDGLPPRFRPRAAIVANRKQYNRVRQLDTAGGANLWVRIGDGLRNSQTGALGEALLGYPSYEASGMSSAITSGASAVTIGDFSYYLIVDRIGMQAEVLPHLVGTNRRPTGQRGLYYFWRNSAVVLAWQAFRTLKVT